VAWLGNFFGAFPEVFAALWEFGDGLRGTGVTVGSLVLFAVCFAGGVRLRQRQGWVSAILSAMAAFIAVFWLFGILPSAWVYFVDSEKELLSGTVIPGAITPVASDFYNVFRDLVVIGIYGVAVVALAAAALTLQKRFPRTLAEGEESRPKSGGYK
jgi:hypothetical protein